MTKELAPGTFPSGAQNEANGRSGCGDGTTPEGSVRQMGNEERSSLGRKEKALLRAALQALPGSLAYLRRPILAIAEEDQDMLGSGEVDMAAIAKAVRQRSKELGEQYDGVEDSASLRKWLEQVPNSSERWCRPAWFVAGVLLASGHILSSPEELDELPKPEPGLRRIEVPVPPGMKSKLYAGGIELRERAAEVFVMEMDEEAYRIGLTGIRQGPVSGWPRNPDHRDELNEDFVSGEVRGVRKMTLEKESGCVVMSVYLLRVGPEEVQVSIFSRGKRGVDLDRWERWIGTIRPK
jgi:hypothetical protein